MALKSITGQTVLITGAGGGFGQAMIRQFLALGCRLILTDRDATLLREIAEAILSKLGQATTGEILGYIGTDLATQGGAQELFTQTQAITPDLDILVNNAGIALSGLISDVPQDRWEALMQINLLAPMRLTALFLPGMIARRRGHIANVSSVAGLIGTPRLSVYSAAKFGLRGFTEALAGDVKPYNIYVTAIYPFFARTPILDSPQFGERMKTTIPDRLLYDPDFVMAHFIRGIRRNQLHVYPGFIPRQLDFLRRVAPWTIPLLNRSMK